MTLCSILLSTYTVCSHLICMCDIIFVYRKIVTSTATPEVSSSQGSEGVIIMTSGGGEDSNHSTSSANGRTATSEQHQVLYIY